MSVTSAPCGARAVSGDADELFVIGTGACASGEGEDLRAGSCATKTGSIAPQIKVRCA
jgi:hypothetical protein